MSDIATALGVLAGAAGLILAYITERRARAVAHVITDFAELSKGYYVMGPDGWTAVEKEALADLAIAFFDAVNEAGVEIARPK